MNDDWPDEITPQDAKLAAMLDVRRELQIANPKPGEELGIECPLCGGLVSCKRDAETGALSGKCLTPDCIAFEERDHER